MKRLLFESDAPATLVNVRMLRHSLEAILTYCIHSEKTQQHILICLSEALTNLVQHSNTSSLSISFSQDNQCWRLEILDNGIAWNPDSHASININEMTTNENERGIALLHALCRQITYRSDNSVNTLKLNWLRPNESGKSIVLIVEDDASLLRLYSTYLAEDFNVKVARDGLEALEILKIHDIQLITSDIKMPLMDGINLRELLAQHRNRSLIPFIFLTSNDNPRMLKQAVEMGIDDYLNKPVHKTQLIQSINRVMQRTRQVHHQLKDRIDKRISSVLKPDLPPLSQDWKLAVASRNTGSGGGDLVLHHINDKNTALILGDIMGHDDSAKFFSYAYAGYLHGLLHGIKQDFTPASLLEVLSENALQEKLLSKVLLTCCVAKLEKRGKLTIASAGHPTPILINKSGINHLDVGGVLPGLVSKTRYHDFDIMVKQGERIVLYTDGLFESAHDQKSRHDLEKELCELLSSTLEENIDVSLSIVMQRFDQMASYKNKDDVTLILLEPM
jgi:CheY-like chemotaxis protein/anti-sigma regulatory factor (Ser/Thr protein kinase)